MQRRALRRHTLSAGIGIVVLVLTGCAPLHPIIPEPPPGADEVVDIVEVDGLPAVTLGDGRTFMLDNLEDWEEDDRRFGPGVQKSFLAAGSGPASLPSEVDLRGYQTPIKDQWGGTCVQFALTAAIEARLRRVYAGNHDLSERFGQLLQKMGHLGETSQPQAACRENQLGAWGGGGLYFQMNLFTKYRLPLESHLPYSTIVDPHSAATDENRCVAGTDQRAIDDWNLRAENLPQVALENARFRAQEVRFCPSGSLSDPGWYEQVLADGYEALFAVGICGGDPIPGNGVWDPGSGAARCGGHAMLMVGYRHSDRVFIVKNSWGYNYDHDEDGFTLMSYDWVTNGYVGAAGYVVSAAADAPYPFIEHLLLGRWYLDHDGWKGVLDIYRWPGLLDSSSLGGAQDRRIGTYWGPDGIARRVNGTIAGHKIEFWIDWNDPNLGYGDQRGHRFTGYLFTQAPMTLAGLMLDDNDGETYGFYGVKGDRLVGEPEGGVPRPEAYLGEWAMNHDGWEGTLAFTAVDLQMATPGYATLVGTYTPQGGSPLAVVGAMNLTHPQVVSFEIPFEAARPQVFAGRLYGHEKGIMSGTTLWGGTTYGFVAARLGDAE
ncbi:MAG: hypothetical protein AB7V19_03980 [Candidatus Bipolaricaulia bacterium]